MKTSKTQQSLSLIDNRASNSMPLSKTRKEQTNTSIFISELNETNHRQSVIKYKRAFNQKERLDAELKKFVIALLCWLVGYQFLLGLFIEFEDVLKNKNNLDILNPSLMILMGLAAYVTTSKSVLPIKTFGLHLQNWRKNLLEALAWTSCFLIGLILLKYLATICIPYYYGNPIFDSSVLLRFDSVYSMLGIYLAYALLVPVQEFIARGVIQGSLEKFMDGKYAGLKSILVSNLIFSSFHVHYDIRFALLSFFPGIFWGFMYLKQKSLIGVGVSHIIIGLFTLLFLGVL